MSFVTVETNPGGQLCEAWKGGDIECSCARRGVAGTRGRDGCVQMRGGLKTLTRMGRTHHASCNNGVDSGGVTLEHLPYKLACRLDSARVSCPAIALSSASDVASSLLDHTGGKKYN